MMIPTCLAVGLARRIVHQYIPAEVAVVTCNRSDTSLAVSHNSPNAISYPELGHRPTFLSCSRLVRQHLRGGRTPAVVPAGSSGLHFRVCSTLGLAGGLRPLPRGLHAQGAYQAVDLFPRLLRLPALGLPLLATLEAQGPHRLPCGVAHARLCGHVMPPWGDGGRTADVRVQ